MKQDYQTAFIVLWLRGGTSYYFRGDGVFIYDPNTDGRTSITLNITTYNAQTTINQEFDNTTFYYDSLTNITSNDGNVGIGTTSPINKLSVNGTVGISSTNTLEFGEGVMGKEINAGKIGYNTFTPGLNIVGAGSTGGNRNIYLYDNLQVANNSTLGGQLCFMKGGNQICTNNMLIPLEIGRWSSSNKSQTGTLLSGTVASGNITTWTIPITFKTPYTFIPTTITATVDVFDVSNANNFRLNPITITNITRTGFTINISTWSATIIYQLGGTWTVYM
jgi:hypothetical protein